MHMPQQPPPLSPASRCSQSSEETEWALDEFWGGAVIKILGEDPSGKI